MSVSRTRLVAANRPSALTRHHESYTESFMMRPRLFLTLPLILLTVIPALSGEQEPRATRQPKQFDELRLPIAEYAAPEPADAQERAKRQAKGRKYSNSEWRVDPNSVSDTMVRVDSVNLKLPALPFEQSSAVIVGQVTDACAYLSSDKTGVYSVFQIQVSEVLKNSSKTPINNGTNIEVERDGGRVRFPNGRLHLYSIDKLEMPKSGLRYVLFLNEDESDLIILTGYELRDGKVYPLDELPNLLTYENSDELVFLSELRTKSH